MSTETRSTISSRDRINQLERELARCAMQFRANSEASDERAAAVHLYHQIMEKLSQIDEWCGTPDLDSQLPEEFMPTIGKNRHPTGPDGTVNGPGPRDGHAD